jgi:hypothetical protein
MSSRHARSVVFPFAFVVLVPLAGCERDENERAKEFADPRPAEEPQQPTFPELPDPIVPGVPKFNGLTGGEVLDKAIEALGGEAARERMKSGYLRFRFSSLPIAGMAELLGGGEVIFESYWKPPRFERRIVRSADGTKEYLFVVTPETLWIRPPGGTTESMATPPTPQKPPGTLAMLSGLIDVRNRDVRLAFDSTSGPERYVLQLIESGELISQIDIDAKSFRVLRERKRFYELSFADLDRSEPTTVEYGEYDESSGIPVPSSMSVSQGGRFVMEATLEELNLDIDLDPELFTRPD